MIELVEGARECGILFDLFGLSVDGHGYVVKDGERVTDGFGVPVERTDVGTVIHFEEYGFSVDDQGYVVDACRDPITEYGVEAPRSFEAVVSFEFENGYAGIVREQMPSLMEFESARQLRCPAPGNR